MESPSQRRAYREGYRDGLRAFAVLRGGRYQREYFAGYNAGFEKSGKTEIRPFETKGA